MIQSKVIFMKIVNYSYLLFAIEADTYCKKQILRERKVNNLFPWNQSVLNTKNVINLSSKQLKVCSFP